MAEDDMAAAKTLTLTLAELRAVGRGRVRRARPPDIAAPLARLIAECRTESLETRANGVAFRLHGVTEQQDPFTITCLVHGSDVARLTKAETEIVELLCDGRTRAQIARVRGVSMNTTKTQIRQIFRKLNVESRVALVRRWCA